VCGNGVLESGEECDDGNFLNGDSCAADCHSELVPGGRRQSADCEHEFLADPPPPRDRDGVPVKTLECTDDDPACDFGATDGDEQCTFHIAMCFNVSEARFACTPTDVQRVRFRRPRDATDAAN